MNVERRQSGIHGNGVFARQDIPEGHWQYIYGELLPLMPHPMEHYCFEHEGGLWLPYAPWCWLNHSETPNCEFDFCEEEDMFVVYSSRDILADEELTIDYGYTP